METRAAWDIGSGTTKLVVVKVDTTKGQIIEKLLSLEVCLLPINSHDKTEILLGIGLEQGGNGELPPSLCEKLEDTVKSYIKQAEEVGATKFAGVATAVFRKAKNGMQHLETLNRTYPINVRLAPQEMEGKLGLFTACAVSGRSKGTTISWDCGVSNFDCQSS